MKPYDTMGLIFTCPLISDRPLAAGARVPRGIPKIHESADICAAARQVRAATSILLA